MARKWPEVGSIGKESPTDTNIFGDEIKPQSFPVGMAGLQASVFNEIRLLSAGKLTVPSH